MRDYQKEITDGIIRPLEAGTAPWQKLWDAGVAPPALQIRFTKNLGIKV